MTADDSWEQHLRAGRKAWDQSPIQFRQWIVSSSPEISSRRWRELLMTIVAPDLERGETSETPETDSYQQVTVALVADLFRQDAVVEGYQLLTALIDGEEDVLGIHCHLEHLHRTLLILAREKEHQGKLEIATRIREIIFEIAPEDIKNLGKLIHYSDFQHQEMATLFYAQALIEILPTVTTSESIRLEDRELSWVLEVLLWVLGVLLKYEAYDLFFSLFDAITEHLPAPDQSSLCAWLSVLAEYYAPARVSNYAGRWLPHDLLRPRIRDAIQSLFKDTECRGFSLMAKTFELCAAQIQNDTLVNLDLPKELAHLKVLSDAMRFYSVSGDIDKTRQLMTSILEAWPLEKLANQTPNSMSLGELKDLSQIFLFLICSLLSYLYDDQHLIRAYQHVAADLYSVYVHSKHPGIAWPMPKKETQDQGKKNFDSLSSVQYGYSQRPLRIGYLGECLRRHSVGYLCHQTVGHHDPTKVQAFCYQVKTKVDSPDDIYDHFKQTAYCFRDLCDMSTPSVVEQIRNDQLDVLVFLDGLYVPQDNDIVALKVAPIQISWLGSDSPGLPEFDYFLVDPYILEASAQQDYREKLVRLPSFVAVDSFKTTPVNPEEFRRVLNIPEDSIIFGSSAYAAKRSPECIAAQLEIIRAVPNSIFLVKGVGDMSRLVEIYKEKAQEQGVDGRLRFMTQVHTSERYRAQLSLWDVVLDTFPYTGATHTLEALYMGVPVLTKVGRHYFGRMSYSPLAQIGLEDCISWTEAEFIERGSRLGRDRDLLASVKQQIRNSRETTVLWDAKRLTQCLESLYLHLMDKHPDSEIPVNFFSAI